MSAKATLGVVGRGVGFCLGTVGGGLTGAWGGLWLGGQVGDLIGEAIEEHYHMDTTDDSGAEFIIDLICEGIKSVTH